MPWVVTAGVPMRSPLVMYGGRGSSGTVFSLRLMPARSSARRAFLPDSSASNGAGRRASGGCRCRPTPVEGRARRALGAGPAALAHDLVRRSRGTQAARPRGTPPPWRRSRGRAARPASRGTRPCRWPRRARLEHRMQPPRGPRSVLCVVNVMMSAPCSTGFGCCAAGDEPGDVGGVEQEAAPRPRRRSRGTAGIDDAGIGGGAGDDHLRPLARGRGRAPRRSRCARRTRVTP